MATIKYVMINGQRFEISATNEEQITLESVKATAVRSDPSLANAEAVLEGDTVTFRFKPGTKGSN